jgi:hypothetical protein
MGLNFTTRNCELANSWLGTALRRNCCAVNPLLELCSRISTAIALEDAQAPPPSRASLSPVQISVIPMPWNR